jgi:hypothetical protein
LGAGPQIGIDYEYRLWNCFFLAGGSSAALLMGQLKNYTTFRSFTPTLTAIGNPQPNYQTTKVPRRAQVVPGFEQRLGLSYAKGWRCFCLTLEVGYQVQIYLNAIQSVDMTAPQVLPALAPFTPDVGVFAVGFLPELSVTLW